MANRIQLRGILLGENNQTDEELQMLRSELPKSVPLMPELNSLLSQLDEDDHDIDSVLSGPDIEKALPRVEEIFKEMETYKDPLKVALKKLGGELGRDQHQSQALKESTETEGASPEPKLEQTSQEDPLTGKLRNMINSLRSVYVANCQAGDPAAQSKLWQQVVRESQSLFVPPFFLDNPTMVSMLKGLEGEVSRCMQVLEGQGGDWLPERAELVTSEAERLRGQLQEEQPLGSLRRRQARFLSSLQRLVFIRALLPCP